MLRRFIWGILFSSVVSVLPCSAATVFRQDGADEKKERVVSVELSVDGNEVALKNLVQGDYIEVYDILGVKIYSVWVDHTGRIIRLKLPRGYYIFKIGDVVRKVVIK